MRIFAVVYDYFGTTYKREGARLNTDEDIRNKQGS